MALRMVIPASEGPVTLAQARNICRIDGTAHDDELTMLISAVTDEAERHLNRSLVSATWELAIDAFPDGEIALGKPDATSITSVKYIYGSNELTMNASDYALDTADEFESWLFPLESWPDTDAAANAVKVRFVAGFGDADDVPESIKMWILTRIKAHFFGENFPVFADSLIETYKAYA